MKTSQYPRLFTLSHEGPQTSREASRERFPFSFSHPSPLFPIICALFRAMEQSQLLSSQSLPHSFPCNGGWGVPSAISSLITRLSPLPAFFYFQPLTHCPIDYPTRIVVLSERSESKDPSVAMHHSPQPSLLCFQQLATVAICKSFVLITLLQWVGWGAVQQATVQKT